MSSLEVTYRVEADDLETAGRSIVSESSVGTWVEVSGVPKRLVPQSRWSKKRLFTVKHDPDLFEPGSIPQLLSAVAGNLFGMKGITHIRVESVTFPSSWMKVAGGPTVGASEIYQYFGSPRRPLVGTIVKPKVGLNPREYAKRVAEAYEGGCDVVKEDENLTDQRICPFEQRVPLALEAARESELKTGVSRLYLPNVTGPAHVALERAEAVKKWGGNAVMFDYLTAGFGVLQTLRRAFPDLILHGHRAMHAAITRNPRHGIAMPVLALLGRLGGLDQQHTGTAVGKMVGDRDEVTATVTACRSSLEGILPTLAVASGGLHPGHIPELWNLFGPPLLVQLGGGIHGHPQGSVAGARGALAAAQAAGEGIPLSQKAKTSPSLARALEQWVL